MALTRNSSATPCRQHKVVGWPKPVSPDDVNAVRWSPGRVIEHVIHPMATSLRDTLSDGVERFSQGVGHYTLQGARVWRRTLPLRLHEVD